MRAKLAMTTGMTTGVVDSHVSCTGRKVSDHLPSLHLRTRTIALPCWPTYSGRTDSIPSEGEPHSYALFVQGRCTRCGLPAGARHLPHICAASTATLLHRAGLPKKLLAALHRIIFLNYNSGGGESKPESLLETVHEATMCGSTVHNLHAIGYVRWLIHYVTTYITHTDILR